MIRRPLAVLIAIASLLGPAAAQERVTIGTLRDSANGALFLAAVRGYFKAEGIDIDMTAYPSDKDVAVALAAGATDFGLAKFTVEAFTYAGRGAFKAIASQTREFDGYDGNEVLVSNEAYAKGLRKPEQIADHSAAVTTLGSNSHYQLGRVAKLKGFKFSSITLKPQGSVEAAARAISNNDVDVAILPGATARALLTANQAKLLTWYSQLDQQQLGALFVSSKFLDGKRATVEKFLRAYRHGAADYYAALMRHDKYGKRISNKASHEAATAIARYVFPKRADGAATVEADAYFIDAQVKLDAEDIARQVRWYQTQGLLDKEFDPRSMVDVSLQ